MSEDRRFSHLRCTVDYCGELLIVMSLHQRNLRYDPCWCSSGSEPGAHYSLGASRRGLVSASPLLGLPLAGHASNKCCYPALLNAGAFWARGDSPPRYVASSTHSSWHRSFHIQCSL